MKKLLLLTFLLLLSGQVFGQQITIGDDGIVRCKDVPIGTKQTIYGETYEVVDIGLLISRINEGVDLESYIGMSCQILIVHNETEDRVYTNIESVMPYKDANGNVAYFAIKSSGNYQRVIDRDSYLQPEEFAMAKNGV